MKVADGYILVDANGKTYPPGSDVEIHQDLVDVTDEFGFFGKPDTYRKFKPGLLTVTINGEWVPGPLELRPA